MNTVVSTSSRFRVALREALGEVELGPGARWADVAGHRIEDEDPRVVRARLAEALYSAWHAGRPIDPDERLPRRLRDSGYERLLTDHTPNHRATLRLPVRATAGPRPDGTTAALLEREGVRVWVPADRIETPSPVVGDEVVVRASALRPALSPGFFFVQGPGARRRDAELLRVYVHITDPTAAPDIWNTVLALLDVRGVGYQAKILSGPRLYPRRDALVVYLPAECGTVVPDLADAVVGARGVGTRTSIFTERVAPGVALAWEPRDTRPGMRGLSFGQHRAGAVAAALVDAACDRGEFETLLEEEFRAGSIDPESPAHNLSAPGTGESR